MKALHYKIYGLLCYLLISSSIWAASNEIKVINGSPAAIGAHDYFASILIKQKTNRFAGLDYFYTPICGASHIGDQLLVTAAHCLNDMDASSKIYLLLGNRSEDMQTIFCPVDEFSALNCFMGKRDNVVDLGIDFEPIGTIAYRGAESNLIEVPLTRTVIHPDYDYSQLKHDIALIQLPQPVSHAELALPSVDQFASIERAGERVKVIGHGDTLSEANNFLASEQLLEASLLSLSDAQCSALLGPDFFSEEMLCAGNSLIEPSDSCSGDSGGPLMDEQGQVLLGIVSWGPTSGANSSNECSFITGVYTDVFQYVDWISGGWKDSVHVYTENDQTYRLGNDKAGRVGWRWLIGLVVVLMWLRYRALKRH